MIFGSDIYLEHLTSNTYIFIGLFAVSLTKRILYSIFPTNMNNSGGADHPFWKEGAGHNETFT